MKYWGAGFSLAFEINRPVINTVLDKFLQAYKSDLCFTKKIGKSGGIFAELRDVEILDLEDPAPLGGVVTDLKAVADIKLRLLGIKWLDTQMELKIYDVEVNLTQTNAQLPKGISLCLLSSSALSLRFPKAKFIASFLLNKILANILSLGIWIALSIFRGKKIEIPIWELVDVFGALGIRYAEESPLLTAQNNIKPTSLLLASDFSLCDTSPGIPGDIMHFLPDATSIGAVVHQKVVTAAVQIAFAKGWVPKQFRVKKWKIYINSIQVFFEKDKIRARGTIKAKRGRCWCRVKVRIHFNAAIEPVVQNVADAPILAFDYDADLNVYVSTSGMLMVLGVLMFAPVFMAITVSMSFVINVMLKNFLPFRTTWSQQGASLSIRADSLNFSGFVPLSMNFPIQLSGHGVYELKNFTKFDLSDNGPELEVIYREDSISLQENELRLAIGLK